LNVYSVNILATLIVGVNFCLF